MRIFGVFDKYFLFVIIIISFMAIIVDAKEYKKHGEI
ncbi:MAG: CLC_0170 family protein, partial [Clostridiaceae bacterium]